MYSFRMHRADSGGKGERTILDVGANSEVRGGSITPSIPSHQIRCTILQDDLFGPAQHS